MEHTDPLTKQLSLLLVPAAIAGIFLIAADSAPYYDILRFICFAALGLIAIGSGVQSNTSWYTVTIASGIAAAITAGIHAVYIIVDTRKLLYLFNLITEPLFTGILVAVGTGFLFLVIQLVIQYIQQRKK